MTTKKDSTKFIDQLKRSNSKIRADRAQRIGKKVENAHSRMVMDIEESISTKQDELDAMMDLSTDNTNTSLNVISKDFDAAEFVKRINKLKTEIRLEQIKLDIAQETAKDWF